MGEHYQLAQTAREALIRGDMAGAKRAMLSLAEQPGGEALPEKLRPMLQDLRNTARSVEKAATLRDVGNGLAGTFARCGKCHEAAGKGPEIASKSMPQGDDVTQHMMRHHWATEQIWAGLVTASAERYRAGAEALAEPAITPEMLGEESVLAASVLAAKDVAKLDRDIHAVAKDVMAANDLRTRAEGYAKLLATCGTCHTLMKRGPQPVTEPPAAAK
jgi:mono/diheme cytochrome c family protein